MEIIPPNLLIIRNNHRSNITKSIHFAFCLLLPLHDCHTCDINFTAVILRQQQQQQKTMIGEIVPF